MDTEHAKAWSSSKAPDCVYNTAATSGTFQQTTTTSLNKLHMITSDKALRLFGGSGAAVTATSGLIWPAYVPFAYIPVEGRESIGWASFDASTANVTVAVVSF